jgi:hypothetical protein
MKGRRKKQLQSRKEKIKEKEEGRCTYGLERKRKLKTIKGIYCSKISLK